MGYVLKLEGEVVLLICYINFVELLDNSCNIIIYEQDIVLYEKMIFLFSIVNFVEEVDKDLQFILCCLL